MHKCRLCGGSDFYKEVGYFFCQTCQTQNENIREEILDIRVDTSTRLRKIKIRRPKSQETGEDLGWTSWELYNFVLIGLTNEVIELGAPSDMKLTVLQLWATYLGKIEVAFTSTRRKSIPKLTRRYNRRDAEIIYGKVQSQKRTRKRRRIGTSTGTSMTSSYLREGTSSLRELNKTKKLLINADYYRYMQFQENSEDPAVSSFSQSVYSTQSSSGNSSYSNRWLQFSSHAKEEIRKIKNISKNLPRDERVQYREKHITTQYKIGPHIITPMRLWAIIYLALRIHNHSMHLGDMIRYGREGHLSYYKLDHLLPAEINLTRSERKFLSQNKEITHKGMRRIIASMARFLGVCDIICSDFLPLVNRYCQELALPRGISLYAERLIALSPPKMVFDINKPYVPNYEGRAMAFIVVVLKTLLGLDGVTEYQICKVAEKINSIASEDNIYDAKLFSFQDWQKYIECRKALLVNFHFPTKLKYNPDVPDTRNLYIKFLEYIQCKGERYEPEMIKNKHLVPWELANAMKKCINNLSEDDSPLQEMDIFPPSLTPLSSYIQQLLDHPLHDLPSIMRTDFFSTKVGYMTKPDLLLRLALQCNLHLNIIESNLHFVEKIVPYFEQTRISSVNELKCSALVQNHDNNKTDKIEPCEDYNEYVHLEMPCEISFDAKKQQYYENTFKAIDRDVDMEITSNFTFNATLPDGRLAIPKESDDSDSDDNESKTYYVNNHCKESMLLEPKFWQRYNLQLSKNEIESIDKRYLRKYLNLKKESKAKISRNAKGQFIKLDILSENVHANESNEFLDDDTIGQNQMDVYIIEKLVNTELDVESDNFPLTNSIDLSGIVGDEDNFLNLSGISFFDKSSVNRMLDEEEQNMTLINKSYEKVNKDTMRFFKPFKDYWMYHCVFSRVKGKNFELFERDLPKSFVWLLNECANILEMPTEDLYEEICLVEIYHSHMFKSNKSQDTGTPNLFELNSKINHNFVLGKW